jgi:hypothetical protein
MTKPWPTVRLGEVLWNNENARGVPEISRGLRRAATTPPQITFVAADVRRLILISGKELRACIDRSGWKMHIS